MRWILGLYAASLVLPAVAARGTGEAQLLGAQALLFALATPPGYLANAGFLCALLLRRRGCRRAAAAAALAALLAALSFLAWRSDASRLAAGFWAWAASIALLLGLALRRGEERAFDAGALHACLAAAAAAAALAVLARAAPSAALRSLVEAPSLLVLAESRNASLGLWAAERLARSGLGAEAAVPRLASALRAPSPSSRYRAARALARYGAASALAVPELVSALESDDAVLAGLAAEALGRIGPAARSAVPALTGRIERSLGGDPEALASVKRIMRLRVPDFESAGLDEVVAGLAHESPLVRHFAETALARRPLEPAAGPELLTLALGSRSAPVRRKAVLALSALGPEARPAVGALAGRLSAEALASDRGEAAKALGRVGPAAAPAAAALAERLRADPDRLVRLYCARALGSIGPRARAAVPALLSARADKDASVRGWAHDALLKIDPDRAAGLGELPPIAAPLRGP